MAALTGLILRLQTGMECCCRLTRSFVCLFLLFCLPAASGSADNNPGLKFLASGKPVGEITLDVMKSKLKTYRIELYDIEYGKEKMYEAFKVEDVLGLAFGDRLDDPDFTDIAFTALDGYESVSLLPKMNEEGGGTSFSRTSTQTAGSRSEECNRILARSISSGPGKRRLPRTNTPGPGR